MRPTSRTLLLSAVRRWFLIQQAKLRNPSIKLYGLPWAFPQWVSCNPGTLTNCTNSPYDRPDQTASYMTSWVHGLKSVYGFDLVYIGSWCDCACFFAATPLAHFSALAPPFAPCRHSRPRAGTSAATPSLTSRLCARR